MGTCEEIFKMKYLVLACVSLALAASSLPQTRTENDLTCDICVDVMTDIDDFITSDTTEQQLVDFIKQLCAGLGAIIPNLEATCNFIIQSQIPALIDAFVHDNLDPIQVCTDVFGACEASNSTTVRL